MMFTHMMELTHADLQKAVRTELQYEIRMIKSDDPIDLARFSDFIHTAWGLRGCLLLLFAFGGVCETCDEDRTHGVCVTSIANCVLLALPSNWHDGVYKDLMLS